MKTSKIAMFAAVAAICTGAFAGEKPAEKYILIENECCGGVTNFIYAMKGQLKSGMRFPSKIVDRNPCADAKCCPKPTVADPAVAFTITVKDNPKCDVKMMCAADDARVIVNIAPLKADKPDEKTLGQRTLKMMWRGFAFANGAGYTKMPPCLLKPIDGSLKSIDALGSCCPCPEAFNNIMMGCAARGLGPTAE